MYVIMTYSKENNIQPPPNITILKILEDYNNGPITGTDVACIYIIL